MTDNRRVRFSSLEGIDRADLPLACEIWFEDLSRASWATSSAIRLGLHLVRYISQPDAGSLSIHSIESKCRIGMEDVRDALTLMQAYGAIESFSFDAKELKAALCLSILQRLRTLEARHRFQKLAAGRDEALPAAQAG